MSRSSSIISSMHKVDTDYLMNALSRVIIRSCSRKGFMISKNCIEYLTNLMVHHPDIADGNGSPILKDNINRLQELCIEKCTCIGPIETLQMQIYFNEEVCSRDELIRENREKMKKCIEQIKKEFFRQMPQSSEDVEKAYHMLVTLMILGSGFGTLTNSSALKETTVALQSVFPVTELSGFLSKPLQEKERDFEELVAIVAGIRLFNRDCQKGGQYIEDLPEVLTREIKTMTETLHGLMEKIGFKIQFLSRAVENYFCRHKAASSSQDLSKSHHKTKASSTLEDASRNIKAEEMKDCLIAAYQFEFFLRSIAQEISEMESFSKVLKGKLGSCLSKIHNIVLYRTAIPTAEIYPLFTDLFNIWSEFQNEIYVINYLSSVTWNLHAYTQILDNLDSAFLEQMIGKDPDNRQRTSLEQKSVKLDEIICNYIEEENTQNFKDLPLELSGFCIWCLVHGEGALIPGNPRLGLCEYNGYYYSFSDLNALVDFGRKPSSYIFEASLVIRRKPQLANLIKIKDKVEISRDNYTQKGETKSDAEIQTELHPVESYIDRNYSWNEWDHRRRALQLAYIRKCRTRSAQTRKSHWHQDAWMYVSLPHKENYSQTNKEEATNVPQPQRFPYGLRGRSSTDFHIIDLTRPVNE